MANDFIRPSTPQLEKIVNDALGQDEHIGNAYDRMKAELHASLHMVSPQAQAEAAATAQALPIPAAPTTWAFTKEIRWADSTGRRPLVIRATSQADLDALEAQVTSH